MIVYVAGELHGTPSVVAAAVDVAMTKLLDYYSVPGVRIDIGYPETWTCRFIDDEPHPDYLEWRLTHDGHELYVRAYEVEVENEDDPAWIPGLPDVP